MNILMIGNGFDLEHGLPTKYTDFLRFVKSFQYAYISAKANPPQTYMIKDEYLKLIFSNCEYDDRVVALHTFIENNLWIDYFQKVYKEHLVDKENWIDFESEIAGIIWTIDEFKKYCERIKWEKKKIKI